MAATEHEDGSIDPIKRLVEETRAALGARMYSVALMSSLALVDICGALEASNGRATGERFREWFEAHLPRELAILDPADAYQLRCGLLHQGRTSGKAYDAIIFRLPTPNGKAVHGAILEDAADKTTKVLMIDLRMFVDELLTAIERWWIAHRSEPTVAANATELARVRATGYSPYWEGSPVIG